MERYRAGLRAPSERARGLACPMKGPATVATSATTLIGGRGNDRRVAASSSPGRCCLAADAKQALSSYLTWAG